MLTAPIHNSEGIKLQIPREIEDGEGCRFLATTIRKPSVTRFSSNKPTRDFFELHSRFKIMLTTAKKPRHIAVNTYWVTGWLKELAQFITICSPQHGWLAFFPVKPSKTSSTVSTLVMPNMICNGFLAVLAAKLIAIGCP
jgi:hypothetical protein